MKTKELKSPQDMDAQETLGIMIRAFEMYIIHMTGCDEDEAEEIMSCACSAIQIADADPTAGLVQ